MSVRILAICLIFIVYANAQESVVDLQPVELQFRNFNYLEVINSADSLILRTENFDTSARLNLLRMKGISEYSLKQQSEAHNTFLAILVVKNTYAMDPVDTSPKILEFYNLIKKSYNSNPRLKSEPNFFSSKSFTTNTQEQPDLKAIIARSIMIPGWGHYRTGNSRTGKWLLTGTLITLPASIYFTWDSYRREDRYLSETNPSKIENLYAKYNTSYKVRNGFLTAYLAIWFYAQFDVFSQKQSMFVLSPQVLAITDYSFSMKVSF